MSERLSRMNRPARVISRRTSAWLHKLLILMTLATVAMTSAYAAALVEPKTFRSERGVLDLLMVARTAPVPSFAPFAIAGDFVYHCHILEHEDGGMMSRIRVRPSR